MNKKRILVVDDEPDIRKLLCISLERMGYEPIAAASCAEAIKLIGEHPFELALTDVRLPDGNGTSLISKFKDCHPQAPIAVMTAYDTTDIAVDAMKKGAFDFLPKPIRQQRLQVLVNDALEQSPSTIASDQQELITGQSESVVSLRNMIEKVAATQAPVLINGESGTGKELAARSIHLKSNRADKPFIAVNCGAIPSELMESELFGHKKGSFTGASSDKIGLFQAAEGGTLLLDEVADLPLSMQVKLLRAVQEKAVRPVGAQEETMVNVRILSASHKDLASEVSSGNFRQDLYYRLNVIELKIPALRNRKGDIAGLCKAIFSSLGAENARLDPSAIALLETYNFPGNIRELENLLQRTLALCDSPSISAKDIDLPDQQSPMQSSKDIDGHGIDGQNALDIHDLEAHLADIEKKIIIEVLEAVRWNRTNAAERLGLTQRQFRYKLAKYHLSEE